MIYDTISNLEFNLKFLLDTILLKDGHYTNIAKGTTIRGYDASKLVLDTESSSDFGGISGCQVWQSPFMQWVYESGITLNQAPFISGKIPPYLASGIYVNGTLFTNAVSGSQFYIDYINGRVIFSGTGIPGNSLVQADYSFKEFRTDFVDGTTAQEDINAYSETYLKDNPIASNVIVYPSGDYRTTTFPCIYIEVDGPSDFRVLELGNYSSKEVFDVYFHIYALNRVQRNVAKEVIKNRIFTSLPLIDYNYAPIPLSGLQNTLPPNPITYETLLTNPTINGNKVVSHTYYVENGSISNFSVIKNYPTNVMSKNPFFSATAILNIIVENVSPAGRISPNPYLT